MGKYKCVICGRDVARRIKMPAGGVNLCTDTQCIREFIVAVTGGVPVVWFDLADLTERESSHPKVVARFEKDWEFKHDLGDTVCDYLWDDASFPDLFNEAMTFANEKLEEEFVKRLPDKELPLYLAFPFKSKKTKELIAKRIKGVTNHE